MLRGLLLVLLLANLAFFVWSRGGAAASGEREPERLARQVRAEAVQLLAPEAVALATAPPVSAASAAANPASAAEAASASEAPASAALLAAPALPPPAAGPPGTRCLEAGPFNSAELALAETALAASAKTRRIARRWVPITPDAASAVAAPQHRLRIDATPGEVAVLEALPASVVGRSFTPCTAR